jgi:hypothetical protein
MNQNSRVTLTSPLWNPAIRGGMVGFAACAVGVGIVNPVGWALVLLPIGWYGVARLLDSPLFDID